MYKCLCLYAGASERVNPVQRDGVWVSPHFACVCVHLSPCILTSGPCGAAEGAEALNQFSSNLQQYLEAEYPRQWLTQTRAEQSISAKLETLGAAHGDIVRRRTHTEREGAVACT
jgi:hypothetical protein